MKTYFEPISLGELIALLEKVEDPTLPIVFDNGKRWPLYLDSWRGAYDELAIAYSKTGPRISCRQFLGHLRNAVGKTFQGYKGGDFTMDKKTPLWVANDGESSAWGKNSRGVITAKERKDFVSILTRAMEY